MVRDAVRAANLMAVSCKHLRQLEVLRGVKLVGKAAGDAADVRKPLAVRPMQVVRKDSLVGLGRLAAEAGQVRQLMEKLESNVISAV